MKVIRVDSCANCPFYGECDAWKKLSSKQRVLIMLMACVPQDYMLKDCHLEDDPNLEPS